MILPGPIATPTLPQPTLRSVDVGALSGPITPTLPLPTTSASVTLTLSSLAPSLLGEGGAKTTVIPSDLGPMAWFDASDAASIVEVGGVVEQWSDKSGNANHATQSLASARPTTGTATQNSLNVLSFDGDDILRNESFGLAGDYTIMMVFKNNNVGAGGFTMPGAMLGDGNTGRPLDYYSSSSGRQTYIDSTGSQPSEYSDSDFDFYTEPSEWRIYTVEYQDANSPTKPEPRIQEFINGFGRAKWNTHSGVHNVVNQSLNIGARDDLVTSLTGEIAEVVVYDKLLENSEFVLIHNHLIDKWGITSESATEAISPLGADVASTTTTATSDSISHTLLAGSDRMVVICTGSEGTSVGETFTYGGVSATFLGEALDATNVQEAKIFYIKEGDLPANGPHTVQMNRTSGANLTFWVGAFEGVDQTGTPSFVTGVDNNVTSVATSGLSGGADSYLIGNFSCNDGRNVDFSWTPGTYWTPEDHITGGTKTHDVHLTSTNAAFTSEPITATVSSSSSRLALIAMVLEPAGPATFGGSALDINVTSTGLVPLPGPLVPVLELVTTSVGFVSRTLPGPLAPTLPTVTTSVGLPRATLPSPLAPVLELVAFSTGPVSRTLTGPVVLAPTLPQVTTIAGSFLYGQANASSGARADAPTPRSVTGSLDNVSSIKVSSIDSQFAEIGTITYIGRTPEIRSHEDVVLSLSPSYYYKLAPDIDASKIDYSGNNYDLTASPVVGELGFTWTANPVSFTPSGEGYELYGTDEWELDNVGPMDPDDFTIEVVLRRSAGIAATEVFASSVYDDGASLDRGPWLLSMLADGRIQAGLDYQASVPTFECKSLKSYSDDEWHHVVFTADRTVGVARLYVDGIEVDVEVGSTVKETSTFWHLGGVWDAPRRWAGGIDHFALYPSVLPGVEIASLLESLDFNRSCGLVSSPVIRDADISLANYNFEDDFTSLNSKNYQISELASEKLYLENFDAASTGYHTLRDGPSRALLFRLGIRTEDPLDSNSNNPGWGVDLTYGGVTPTLVATTESNTGSSGASASRVYVMLEADFPKGSGPHIVNVDITDGGVEYGYGMEVIQLVGVEQVVPSGDDVAIGAAYTGVDQPPGFDTSADSLRCDFSVDPDINRSNQGIFATGHQGLNNSLGWGLTTSDITTGAAIFREEELLSNVDVGHHWVVSARSDDDYDSWNKWLFFDKGANTSCSAIAVRFNRQSKYVGFPQRAGTDVSVSSPSFPVYEELLGELSVSHMPDETGSNRMIVATVSSNRSDAAAVVESVSYGDAAMTKVFSTIPEAGSDGGHLSLAAFVLLDADIPAASGGPYEVVTSHDVSPGASAEVVVSSLHEVGVPGPFNATAALSMNSAGPSVNVGSLGSSTVGEQIVETVGLDYNFNHTLVAGTDRIVLFGVSGRTDSGQTVDNTVTYGGVSANLLVRSLQEEGATAVLSGPQQHISWHYILEADLPADGVNTVQVNRGSYGGVETTWAGVFDNVEQLAPDTATGIASVEASGSVGAHYGPQGPGLAAQEGPAAIQALTLASSSSSSDVVETIGTAASGQGNGDYSFSHTLASGNNRIVLIAIMIQTQPSPPNSEFVTYGGVNARLLSPEVVYSRDNVRWHYVLEADLPADGVNTVQVSDGSSEQVCWVNAYENVSQLPPTLGDSGYIPAGNPFIANSDNVSARHGDLIVVATASERQVGAFNWLLDPASPAGLDDSYGGFVEPFGPAIPVISANNYSSYYQTVGALSVTAELIEDARLIGLVANPAPATATTSALSLFDPDGLMLIGSSANEEDISFLISNDALSGTVRNVLLALSLQGSSGSPSALGINSNSALSSGGNYSFSHTLDAGSDRVVLIAVMGETNPGPPDDTVTYGGVSATLLARASTVASGWNQHISWHYVLEADLPANGVNTVQINRTNPSDQTAWAGSFSGVVQAAPATASAEYTSNVRMATTSNPIGGFGETLLIASNRDLTGGTNIQSLSGAGYSFVDNPIVKDYESNSGSITVTIGIAELASANNGITFSGTDNINSVYDATTTSNTQQVNRTAIATALPLGLDFNWTDGSLNMAVSQFEDLRQIVPANSSVYATLEEEPPGNDIQTFVRSDSVSATTETQTLVSPDSTHHTAGDLILGIGASARNSNTGNWDIYPNDVIPPTGGGVSIADVRGPGVSTGSESSGLLVGYALPLHSSPASFSFYHDGFDPIEHTRVVATIRFEGVLKDRFGRIGPVSYAELETSNWPTGLNQRYQVTEIELEEIIILIDTTGNPPSEFLALAGTSGVYVNYFGTKAFGTHTLVGENGTGRAIVFRLGYSVYNKESGENYETVVTYGGKLATQVGGGVQRNTGGAFQGGTNSLFYMLLEKDLPENGSHEVVIETQGVVPPELYQMSAHVVQVNGVEQVIPTTTATVISSNAKPVTDQPSTGAVSNDTGPIDADFGTIQRHVFAPLVLESNGLGDEVVSVGIDSVSESFKSIGGTTVDNFDHKLGTGTDRMFLCCVIGGNPTDAPLPGGVVDNTVTYGGVAATLLGRVTQLSLSSEGVGYTMQSTNPQSADYDAFEQHISWHYILEADLPADGVNNVAVTKNNSGIEVAWAGVFKNVKQVVPRLSTYSDNENTVVSFTFDSAKANVDPTVIENRPIYFFDPNGLIVLASGATKDAVPFSYGLSSSASIDYKYNNLVTEGRLGPILSNTNAVPIAGRFIDFGPTEGYSKYIVSAVRLACKDGSFASPLGTHVDFNIAFTSLPSDYNFTHTLEAGGDRVVVIAMAASLFYDATGPIDPYVLINPPTDEVTYGGVTATYLGGATSPAGSVGNTGWTRFYYVLEADLPADGVNTIQVNRTYYGGSSGGTANWVGCFSGIDQSAPGPENLNVVHGTQGPAAGSHKFRLPTDPLDVNVDDLVLAIGIADNINFGIPDNAVSFEWDALYPFDMVSQKIYGSNNVFGVGIARATGYVESAAIATVRPSKVDVADNYNGRRDVGAILDGYYIDFPTPTNEQSLVLATQHSPYDNGGFTVSAGEANAIELTSKGVISVNNSHSHRVARYMPNSLTFDTPWTQVVFGTTVFTTIYSISAIRLNPGGGFLGTGAPSAQYPQSERTSDLSDVAGVDGIGNARGFFGESEVYAFNEEFDAANQVVIALVASKSLDAGNLVDVIYGGVSMTEIGRVESYPDESYPYASLVTAAYILLEEDFPTIPPYVAPLKLKSRFGALDGNDQDDQAVDSHLVTGVVIDPSGTGTLGALGSAASNIIEDQGASPPDYNFSHTLVAGSDRILLIGVSGLLTAAGNNDTTVTYGGVSSTPLLSQESSPAGVAAWQDGNAHYIKWFYILESNLPADGVNSLVVSRTHDGGQTVWVNVYENAEQTAPDSAGVESQGERYVDTRLKSYAYISSDLPTEQGSIVVAWSGGVGTTAVYDLNHEAPGYDFSLVYDDDSRDSTNGFSNHISVATAPLPGYFASTVHNVNPNGEMIMWVGRFSGVAQEVPNTSDVVFTDFDTSITSNVEQTVSLSEQGLLGDLVLGVFGSPVTGSVTTDYTFEFVHDSKFLLSTDVNLIKYRRAYNQTYDYKSRRGASLHAGYFLASNSLPPSLKVNHRQAGYQHAGLIRLRRYGYDVDLAFDQSYAVDTGNVIDVKSCIVTDKGLGSYTLTASNAVGQLTADFALVAEAPSSSDSSNAQCFVEMSGTAGSMSSASGLRGSIGLGDLYLIPAVGTFPVGTEGVPCTASVGLPVSGSAASASGSSALLSSPTLLLAGSVGNSSALGSQVDFNYARWRFIDPLVGDSYPFEINPSGFSSSAGLKKRPKSVIYNNTDANNHTLVFTRSGENLQVNISGVLTSEEQLSQLQSWAKRRYPIKLRDDLQREYDVYIQSFDAEREHKSDTEHYHSYTLVYSVIV